MIDYIALGFVALLFVCYWVFILFARRLETISISQMRAIMVRHNIGTGPFRPASYLPRKDRP